jgi:hypothetical protein
MMGTGTLSQAKERGEGRFEWTCPLLFPFPSWLPSFCDNPRADCGLSIDEPSSACVHITQRSRVFTPRIFPPFGHRSPDAVPGTIGDPNLMGFPCSPTRTEKRFSGAIVFSRNAVPFKTRVLFEQTLPGVPHRGSSRPQSSFRQRPPRHVAPPAQTAER